MNFSPFYSLVRDSLRLAPIILSAIEVNSTAMELCQYNMAKWVVLLFVVRNVLLCVFIAIGSGTV